MATKTIYWVGSSGDKITLTYSSAVGDQSVLVASDPNTSSSSRSKTITFTPTGGTAKTLSVTQDGKPKEYINFADPVVASICKSNYSSDGIGVTMEDAAAVTTIGTKFYNNANITSFDELQYFTGLTELSNNAFYGDANLVSVVLPSNIVTLGQRAFRGCTKLESIGSFAHLTSIGYQAFYDCRALDMEVNATSLQQLPGNGAEFYNTKISRVTSLGTLAQTKAQTFSTCASLVSVVLPSTITNLAQWTFFNCTSLTTVTIYATAPPTFDRAFQGCSNLSAIYVPAGSVNAYKAASGWSGYSSIIQAIP